MSDRLIIAMTSKEGVSLNTKGTYIDKTIDIIPQLEDVTITPTKEVQVITSEDNVGIGKATIEAIPDEYVIPEGEVILDKNGSHDVSGKATAIVDVLEIGGGVNEIKGIPIEVATEAEMMRLRETFEVGQIVKYTGETGIYESGAIYIVEEVSE